MDNFWKWVEENEYGVASTKELIGDDGDHILGASKRMLIGFMLDYCNSRELKMDMFEFAVCFEDIEKFYEYLERVINER